MKALESYGCTFAVSTGSPTEFSAVANISSIRGPGEAAGVIDVSNLDSQAVEKLMMVPDEGQVALDIYYDPSNAIHALLSAARRTRSRLEFRISLSDSDPTQMTFFGFVTAFMLNTATSQAVRAAVMIDVDGAATDRQASDEENIIFTGPYATWNPSAKSAHLALSGGNLIATSDNFAAYLNVTSTGYVTTGKRYAEIVLGGYQTGSAQGVGIVDSTVSIADNAQPGYLPAGSMGYVYDGANVRKQHNGVLTAYGASWAWSGARIGVLFNAHAGTLSFWRSGVDQGVAFTGITGAQKLVAFGYKLEASCRLYSDPATWAHTPPAGYVGWPLS